jgi:hypothetical protein
VCWQICLSVETIECDDSLHFGKVYHEHRILHEIPEYFHVSAGIFDWWAGLKQKFLRFFVNKSYADKVIKAFAQRPIGHDAAAKRSAWGNFTRPGQQEV